MAEAEIENEIQDIETKTYFGLNKKLAIIICILILLLTGIGSWLFLSTLSESSTLDSAPIEETSDIASDPDDITPPSQDAPITSSEPQGAIQTEDENIPSTQVEKDSDNTVSDTNDTKKEMVDEENLIANNNSQLIEELKEEIEHLKHQNIELYHHLTNKSDELEKEKKLRETAQKKVRKTVIKRYADYDDFPPVETTPPAPKPAPQWGSFQYEK